MHSDQPLVVSHLVSLVKDGQLPEQLIVGDHCTVHMGLYNIHCWIAQPSDRYKNQGQKPHDPQKRDKTDPEKEAAAPTVKAE